MEEQVIEFLSSPIISPFWILLVAFFFQFIENLFPPSPSDVILLFLGSLVSFDKVGFVPLVAIATIGSTLGFATMFTIGKIFGERILDTGKFKFITKESLDKTRRWFNRWGYGIVVANRFLSGTRAVVSFFAGIAELSTWKSTLLAGVSAFVWNFIIIYAGMSLGRNWKLAVNFLELYWKVVLVVIAVIIASYLIYTLLKRQKVSTK
ncbi:MAG: DedA family protein [Ignavibacteria bacterium]|nr:DedA family protein [Ignavibacteria bacterium]